MQSENSNLKQQTENSKPKKGKREMTVSSARGHNPQRVVKGFGYAGQKERPRR
jgi:hypothetical protein